MSCTVLYNCNIISYKDKLMFNISQGSETSYGYCPETGKKEKEKYSFIFNHYGKIFFTKDEMTALLKSRSAKKFWNIKKEDNLLTYDKYLNEYCWYNSLKIKGKQTSFNSYLKFMLKEVNIPIQYTPNKYYSFWDENNKLNIINENNIEAFYQESFK